MRRFYHRQGALLALLYVLDGTDMHYENLIAVGEQPVLVDVETLFHPSHAPAGALSRDPAYRALLSSVYRTALLPLLVSGEHGVADMSGLVATPMRQHPPAWSIGLTPVWTRCISSGAPGRPTAPRTGRNWTG